MKPPRLLVFEKKRLQELLQKVEEEFSKLKNLQSKKPIEDLKKYIDEEL